jgi:hypothetical protein
MTIETNLSADELLVRHAQYMGRLAVSLVSVGIDRNEGKIPKDHAAFIDELVEMCEPVSMCNKYGLTAEEWFQHREELAAYLSLALQSHVTVAEAQELNRITRLKN